MDASADRLLAALRPYLAYVTAPLGVYALYKLLCRCVPGPQQQRRLDVRDRTVLITGASSGLGRALAFVFYERGAKLVLAARSIDKLQQLCEELRAEGRRRGWTNAHAPAYRYLDLAEIADDEAAAHAALGGLRDGGGRIDVLVNCAGVAHRGTAVGTRLRVLAEVMRVNFMGQGYMDALRCESRPSLQLLSVNVGYINTGFGSRGLTADGARVGTEDENQKRGYAPDYAARRIVDALESRATELVLAPLLHRLVLVLRLFTPNLLFWLLHRRGQKLLEHEKPE